MKLINMDETEGKSQEHAPGEMGRRAQRGRGRGREMVEDEREEI